VLVFVQPGCDSCRGLLPRLVEWRQRLASQLTIVLISDGSADANRELLDGHAADGVLLQDRAEVYHAFELRQGVPAAVVVDPDRTIGSVAVSGNLAIESLIRITLQRSEAAEQPSVVA
jgi:hypothetical protein